MSIIIQQRSLSIATLVGALQSAVWFFVLPLLVKPYWARIFGNFTNPQAEVLLWAIGAPYMLLYIIVAAIPSYFIDVKFIQQYKISKDPWPWRSTHRQQFWNKTYKSIMLDFFNFVIFIPTLIHIKTVLFSSHVRLLGGIMS